MHVQAIQLATILALVVVTIAQPLVTSEWSSFHGPDGHTRAWPSDTITTTNGTVKWTFTADGPILSPALSAEGVLYFATCSGTMFAVFAGNGTLKWKNTVSTFAYCGVSSPSVGLDGLVYVGIPNNTLYAFNGSSGAVVWHKESDCQSMPSTPAVDAEGSVFLGFGSSFCSLNGRSGAKQWCHKSSSAVDGPPTLSRGGVVYAVLGIGIVFAYDAASGSLRWSTNLEALTYGGPVLDDNGVLYVGIEATLVALNVTDGGVLWTFPTRDFIYQPPSVANGVVYVGSNDGNVYAIHRNNGSVLWTFQTMQGVDATPAIGSDGTVYVGSYDGNLYALDGHSGALRWKYTSDGSVLSSLVGPDGTVYAASCGSGSTLYAFTPSSV